MPESPFVGENFIRKEVEMKKGKKDISLTWKASLFFVKSQGI